MSRISARRNSSARGFSLLELMIALSLSAIVLAAIIAAYLFVGRNLTRLVNLQQQETKSRRTLKMFTTDLSAAISLTTSTDTQIVLTKPTAASTETVTYTYTAGAGNTGTFTRTDSTGTLTLLTNLSAFDFSYYSESGNAIANSSPQSVKSVEFTFTSKVGTSSIGTETSSTIVSPRVVLRNKPALN
jgi:prepilin-type N-terminal cleavage/methylation domain-containing protein